VKTCSNYKGDWFVFLLTVFITIKAELFWRRSWETRGQAETAIFDYINGFYSPRRHSGLGRKSPAAF
jgi:putative transposase